MFQDTPSQQVWGRAYGAQCWTDTLDTQTALEPVPRAQQYQEERAGGKRAWTSCMTSTNFAREAQEGEIEPEKETAPGTPTASKALKTDGPARCRRPAVSDSIFYETSR